MPVMMLRFVGVFAVCLLAMSILSRAMYLQGLKAALPAPNIEADKQLCWRNGYDYDDGVCRRQIDSTWGVYEFAEIDQVRYLEQYRKDVEACP